MLRSVPTLKDPTLAAVGRGTGPAIMGGLVPVRYYIA